MTRVLLCVGCDSYSYLNPLKGAENDAKGMFNLLTSPAFGNYDKSASLLLLSPSKNELFEALSSLLVPNIETFTFFFAGHGGLKAGAYYLCAKDSVTTAFSTSALGLSALFGILNECAPKQTNIIIDACEAGGVVADLNALLKPEIIGGANTPGITIFAAAASDQYAAEEQGVGICTKHVVAAINGTTRVQTNRSSLDLLEVGQSVAETLKLERPEQSPMLWGLNLFGSSAFARNPHFDPSSNTSFPQLTGIPASSILGEKISKHADSIWKIYRKAGHGLTPRALNNVLREICGQIADEPIYIAEFILGMSRSLADRCKDSENLFEELEIRAGAISILGEYGENPIVAEVIYALVSELAQNSEAVARIIVEEIKKDSDFLLNYKTIYGDFFYLPLRVTRTLGWLAGVGTLANQLDIKCDVMSAIEIVTQSYGPSIVAISDEQAPFVLITAKYLLDAGRLDIFEAIVGGIFESFVSRKGAIADDDVKPDEALDYVIFAGGDEFEGEPTVLAQPSELLAVLLGLGCAAKMDDVIDPFLEQIDHCQFNVFCPSNHCVMSKRQIREGLNFTFRIGMQVFTLADFSAQWKTYVTPYLATDHSLKSVSVQISAVCSSMLFPDRSPFFMLDGAINAHSAVAHHGNVV